MKMPVLALMAAGLLLGGCRTTAEPTVGLATATRTSVPSATAPANPPEPGALSEADTRIDEQGMVVFEVTPLNLGSPGDTLDFAVAMNTHSVDLGWDLAAQSVLQTDTGLEVGGIGWPVGSGHHYEGTLSFPGRTADGAPFLDGATVLTLVIRDTDVPERTFVWEVPD